VKGLKCYWGKEIDKTLALINVSIESVFTYKEPHYLSLLHIYRSF